MDTTPMYPLQQPGSVLPPCLWWTVFWAGAVQNWLISRLVLTFSVPAGGMAHGRPLPSYSNTHAHTHARTHMSSKQFVQDLLQIFGTFTNKNVDYAAAFWKKKMQCLFQLFLLNILLQSDTNVHTIAKPFWHPNWGVQSTVHNIRRHWSAQNIDRCTSVSSTVMTCLDCCPCLAVGCVYISTMFVCSVPPRCAFAFAYNIRQLYLTVLISRLHVCVFTRVAARNWWSTKKSYNYWSNVYDSEDTTSKSSFTGNIYHTHQTKVNKSLMPSSHLKTTSNR